MSTLCYFKSARSRNIRVSSGSSIVGGLGLISTNTILPNSVILQVPNHLTFTVSNSPLDINPTIESYFANKKVYRDAPYWAKLGIDLCNCDKVSSLRPSIKTDDDSKEVDMRPWLNSLPRCDIY